MSHLRRVSTLTIAFLLLLVVPAQAGGVRLISADATGVTLQVNVPDYRVHALADGRNAISVPGYGITSAPGRPQLPYARTLVAVPPGARAVARVTSSGGGQSRTDLAVAIGGEPSIQPDPEGLRYVPYEEQADPILDGSWPTALVQVGDRFVVRRQHVVPVAIHPFRYDDATRRLDVTRSITVRVDFVGGRAPRSTPAPPDRHWDSVLERAVINFEQGRAFRGPRAGARWMSDPESRSRVTSDAAEGRSLFDRDLPGERALAGKTAFRSGPRSVAAGPLGTAGFDEDHPEVRVRIDSTGVHAIRFNDLQANGYPSGVPIGEVSLHRHEFDPSAVAPAPPYMTIELPIEVYDANSNGTFDLGDAIVAYVQSWTDRTNPSVARRAWGDADVVYATRLLGGSGLRVNTRTGARGQVGLTPEASYPYTDRLERNFQYMTAYRVPGDTASVDPFHWTNIALYYDRADTILIDTNDIDTTRSALVTSDWVGRRNGSHFLWTRLTNGDGRVTQLSDSSTSVWTGRVPFSTSLAIPGGALTPGLTNRFGFWGKPLGTAPGPGNEVDFIGLNWIEWQYWRSYRALQGYLKCNSGAGLGEIEFVARGFADTTFLRAYDVTNPLDPTRLVAAPIEPDGGGWQMRLQDSVAVGTQKQYVVFSDPKAVPAANYSAVNRRQLTNRTSGDYLLIVPEAWMSNAQALADFRSNQGLSVLKAPLEAVNDEFNGGRPSAYSLRRFVRFAYENWDVRFVMLMGDASEDPLNHTRTARADWIPTQNIGGPVPFSTGSESAFERIPSDNWYGWCVTCTDTDLQFAPQVPEVMIGRFPVNSAAEVSAVVNKVTRYENFSDDQLWRRKMVLQADDEYSGVTTFGGGGGGTSSYCRKFFEDRFRLLNETIRDVILVEAGLVQCEPEVFDLGVYLANEPEDQNQCRPDRFATQLRTRTNVTPELFARLNDGRLWWNYQGHANEYEIGHEDVYRNITSDDDITKFLNDDKLFFFSGFACHPNSFGRAHEAGPLGPSFGEELVTLPNRGAVASWGSSGYEIIPHNGFDHVNVELARSMFVDPPRDPYLGENGARPVLGEVIGLALVNWRAQAGPWPFEQKVGMSYILLGDPATRLWVGPAQGALTANTVPVTSGTPIRLQTPGDSLRIRADLVSNASLSDLRVIRSDSLGVDTLSAARFSVMPSFPDTSAASHGGRRYNVAIDTTGVPRTFSYLFETTDRYGITAQHEALFTFETTLRAGGQLVNDGDPVAPTADLTLQVLSPAPVNPTNDLTLTINGQPVPFAATPLGGDPSGREWTLSWTHPPYPIDTYVLQLDVNGGATRLHVFNVQVGGSELRIDNPIAFPNPFQEDIGTHFSFTLVSGVSANVSLRVYTVAGKIVHQSVTRGLAPGYHQIKWDGRDAEGTHVANGTYFFRMIADNGQSKAVHEGRLVKLRRPRTSEPEELTP